MANVPTTPNGFHTVMASGYPFTVPDKFTNLRFINGGSQGTVASAEDSFRPEDDSRRKVAIKKMITPMVNEGNAIRLMREISLISSVNHPNIITAYSVFTPQTDAKNFTDVYLVMELMSNSLSDVIQNLILDRRTLSFWIYQILCGVNHLHREGIVHRDLKPCNLAVNKKCQVKVLDFGSARTLIEGEMSAYVVTRYYRAPEIVLTPSNQIRAEYTSKVDVWSIGCIFAELITGKVLFPGASSPDQWQKIVNILGTPSESFISQVDANSAREMRMRKIPAKSFEEIIPDESYPEVDPNGSDPNWTASAARRLISKMLKIDPNERCSIEEALEDPYVMRWHRENEVKAPLSNTIRRNMEELENESLETLKSRAFDEVQQANSLLNI